jgi:hypothetical protein
VPESRALGDYETALNNMVEHLKGISGVRSIYQIGSVSNPGISDIDMLVVFENDAVVALDPVVAFRPDRYLFTHQLYGVPEKYWSQLRSLTFFHNYKLIYGEGMPEVQSGLSLENENELKRQIALEFLIKMHHVLTIQLRYRILKLRTFLLEGKALIYDLEFLGITEGPFFESVNKIIDWRASWFNSTPKETDVEQLVVKLNAELESLLKHELNRPVLLPSVADQVLARNVRLCNGPFAIKSSGLVFPDLGILPPKKHFNLLHRFNSFQFQVPMALPKSNSINSERFELLRQLRAYNQQHLPGFLIPASSLKVI